jgi:hypothetical protein
MKHVNISSHLTAYFKNTWELGARGIRARGLSDYVEGSWRDRNYARKYPRLA